MRTSTLLRAAALILLAGAIAAALLAPIPTPACSLLEEGACPTNSGWRALIGAAGLVVAFTMWSLAWRRDRRSTRRALGLEP